MGYIPAVGSFHPTCVGNTTRKTLHGSRGNADEDGRFTPTCVGTTISPGRPYSGEYARTRGSPPRAWGIRTTTPPRRFTPRAWNRLPAASASASARFTPRAWGIPWRPANRQILGRRFTPTCVGNTIHRASSRPAVIPIDVLVFPGDGSPPRAWGIPYSRDFAQGLDRLAAIRPGRRCAAASPAIPDCKPLFVVCRPGLHYAARPFCLCTLLPKLVAHHTRYVADEYAGMGLDQPALIPAQRLRRLLKYHHDHWTPPSVGFRLLVSHIIASVVLAARHFVRRLAVLIPCRIVIFGSWVPPPGAAGSASKSGLVPPAPLAG